MHSSWRILSTLAAHPLVFCFHPIWHLWLGLAPLHGKCSCWGISCQGLSNGLDKGVYLFIPAEALDWSWSRSICVLTGMSAGGGTWLLWKSSYALLVAELFPTLEHRMLVGYALLHSVFALYLLPWMSAYTKLWPPLTQCSKIGKCFANVRRMNDRIPLVWRMCHPGPAGTGTQWGYIFTGNKNSGYKRPT